MIMLNTANKIIHRFYSRKKIDIKVDVSTVLLVSDGIVLLYA